MTPQILRKAANRDAGRVAVVSGGTSGIGLAVSLLLAERGYSVAALGNDAEQRREAAEIFRRNDLTVDLFPADVAVSKDVSDAVSAVLDSHGRIDVLCNNAAIRPVGDIRSTDETTWDRTFAVNVKSMYLLSRAVIPSMVRRGGGSIVNVGSPSGYGGRGHLAYSTSKGAVIAFSKSLAVDHLGEGIRVNVVIPGFTVSRMTDALSKERHAAVKRQTVGGQLRTASEVASVIAFLASEEAATITGATWEAGSIEGQMVLSPG